jgi:hypothetical protein
VNPSDVKNVEGQMEGTVLPRVPGRDFSGVVEAGPPDWIGAEVWGTGGDAGFILDGSHAEAIAIPEAALARKPSRLDHAQAASVGVTFVVGWLASPTTPRCKRARTSRSSAYRAGSAVLSRSLPERLAPLASLASTGIRLPKTRPPPPALTPMWPPMETSRQQSGCTRAGMARMSSSMR